MMSAAFGKLKDLRYDKITSVLPTNSVYTILNDSFCVQYPMDECDTIDKDELH